MQTLREGKEGKKQNKNRENTEFGRSKTTPILNSLGLRWIGGQRSAEFLSTRFYMHCTQVVSALQVRKKTAKSSVQRRDHSAE
jgi:hypothetical protein